MNGTRYDPARCRGLHAEAQQLFETAMNLQGAERTRKFTTAGKRYKQAASFWPGSTLAEECLMMSADAYYFADQYPKAVEMYAQLIKRHPNTRFLDLVDQRRFAIAAYWLRLCDQNSSPTGWINIANNQYPAIDTFGHAVKLLDQIRFDNPTGKLADDATMRAAVANFQRGKYSQADILFTDIRDNFPHSEHQFQSHLLGLKCKQELYDGPDYEGGVLTDAEKIIHQMVRIFPEESRQHQEYLERELKDIRLKMAEREFRLAKYYDNRKEYGAARVYYELVRNEYRDTNLSLESEARLAQIGGLPTTPKNSMQWLADLFPEETPARPLLARDNVGTISR